TTGNTNATYEKIKPIPPAHLRCSNATLGSFSITPTYQNPTRCPSNSTIVIPILPQNFPPLYVVPAIFHGENGSFYISPNPSSLNF
ncbi:hypothetical protein HK096_000977, partial [Nowakowskiella sp. JEL0078]